MQQTSSIASILVVNFSNSIVAFPSNWRPYNFNTSNISVNILFVVMHIELNYFLLAQIIFSNKFEILRKVETSNENYVKSLRTYNNER